MGAVAENATSSSRERESVRLVLLLCFSYLRMRSERRK